MTDSINLIAPVNQLGYGVAGFNVLRELSKIVRVSFWPIGQISCPEEYHGVLQECITNAKNPDFNAPCIRIWHQNDMSQFVGNGQKIGFPVFELDSFTSQEKIHLSHLDTVFVCSEWAKEVCLENNIIKENLSSPAIKVIPLGVDSELFKPKESTRKETVFFNCGKWEIRKGHDVIIEAFTRSFNEDDDVELWMMCENPFYSDLQNKEWEELYKNSPLGKKIKIIPRQPTQKEVYNIMAEVDCGVFPARAEGWNLELLELMSCGKHVIATDYSGHTEFCNKNNCLLVNVDEKEDAFDGKWFYGQGKWAKVGKKQVNQLSYYMSMIHRAKKDDRLFLSEVGIKTAENFSWSKTARDIINAISE